MTWKLEWEADLTPADHDGLSALLSAVYPNHRQGFSARRSFSGARPEGRMIGYRNGQRVAHLGFIRRTLRVDDGSGLLVGDVGLVGVHPSLHGQGIGLQLLHETAIVFRSLTLPFGFLTCRPAVVPFYERGGWSVLPDQVARMLDDDERPETYRGPALALPVLAALADWPHGREVIRDGLEV